MILRDTTEVQASPADVFAFFEDMDQARYLSWHPDHKVFRWTRGKGVRPGNEFYFEEVIAGKLLKKNVVFTRIEEGKHIEFAPTFRLMRMFLPRMIFRLEPISEGRYRFIAEIFIRVGPIGARLNKKEFDAVREHMRIEGINLKRFAEARHAQQEAGV
ncbi:MAG: SRPBCC family protein [Blastocatellales bacterium]|nr:SRPBCC family protein [Blastocatellales bacterium]